MFTGIVERTGTITSTRQQAGGRELRIDAGPIARDCILGASVCLSGVCLTVTHIDSDQLTFDVITETLCKTTLGNKRVGDMVNLERSLSVGDRLDGHFVQGHIDGKAVVDRIHRSAQEHVVWLRADTAVQPYLIPKGSVAVDGVSLTIAAVEKGTFSIALIPTTLDRTTLSSLTAGDAVNIESDIITRTIVHRLEEMRTGGGLSLGTLREAGYA